ncbi:MAG: formyltransferase family protein [bacterium]
MPPKPIHDPEKGPLLAVALMSGSGTNLRKILEHEKKLKEREGRELIRIAGIFSDSWESSATGIGHDFDIPVITHDLRGWLRKHNVQRKDLERRRDFDRHNLELLKPLQAEVAIYAGYMSIASPELIHAYTGVNVHPADLSVTDGEGKRKWTGAHAVRQYLPLKV